MKDERSDHQKPREDFNDQSDSTNLVNDYLDEP